MIVLFLFFCCCSVTLYHPSPKEKNSAHLFKKHITTLLFSLDFSSPDYNFIFCGLSLYILSPLSPNAPFLSFFLLKTAFNLFQFLLLCLLLKVNIQQQAVPFFKVTLEHFETTLQFDVCFLKIQYNHDNSRTSANDGMFGSIKNRAVS